MMNIESNQYRIRSVSGSMHELKNLKTGETKFIQYTLGASRLAGMTEAQFDRDMKQRFDEAK